MGTKNTPEESFWATEATEKRMETELANTSAYAFHAIKLQKEFNHILSSFRS